VATAAVLSYRAGWYGSSAKAGSSAYSISTRQPTLPSASPSDCGITAATPSSAAHSPARIRPGRKARVVLPGGSMRGLAVYSASVEKPSAEIVTSRWLEPPHPRNSRGPHVPVVPARRGSYSPRSSVWRLLPDSGWSQQYFTRIAVVPLGTSKGTIT
jgi:hypothetical protein